MLIRRVTFRPIVRIPEFIAKWRKVDLKERSASQEHFIDLCNAFDHPTPAAAMELNALRENWLNPPEWTQTEVLEFSGTVGGPWDRYIDPATVADRGSFKVGTVHYPRLEPLNANCAARLKERNLTKLYSERPPWLATCHEKLDAAVAAAYGWPADLSDDDIRERLLELNLEASKHGGGESP